MSDVTDIRNPHGRIERERVRVVTSLRALADQLEATPKDQLVYALPIAAATVGDLRRRLAPWLK